MLFFIAIIPAYILYLLRGKLPVNGNRLSEGGRGFYGFLAKVYSPQKSVVKYDRYKSFSVELTLSI